eukprot:2390931-Alexandrium_andersonii.AAC.1
MLASLLKRATGRAASSCRRLPVPGKIGSPSQLGPSLRLAKRPFAARAVWPLLAARLASRLLSRCGARRAAGATPSRGS